MEFSLVHVPHSSTYFPEDIVYTCSSRILKHAVLKMTDHYCDELFNCGRDMLIFGCSRIVCDVERFRDSSLESMEKYGIGAVYTRSYDGSKLREIDEAQREYILQRFYDPHHYVFERNVEEKLQRYGRCLVIDGHSFYPEPLPYEEDKTERPDFCIGIDEYHTPEELVSAAVDYFEMLGFTVKVNSPYSGSIVPIKYYRHDKRVASIMLEINRKLYIDEKANKKPFFSYISEVVSGFVDIVENKKLFLQ